MDEPVRTVRHGEHRGSSRVIEGFNIIRSSFGLAALPCLMLCLIAIPGSFWPCLLDSPCPSNRPATVLTFPQQAWQTPL